MTLAMSSCPGILPEASPLPSISLVAEAAATKYYKVNVTGGTLSNGKTTFFKDAFVEKGSFTAREVSDWWSLTHFHSWTIPVLKGKPFKLTVTNKRNSTHMYVNTEAKVQLFYVGAE